MSENQQTEYKESWRDEFLKHICAFANSQGGLLYIGMKDNGEVIGVPGTKKLLEDIPNKVIQLLGITVDIELKVKKNKEVIEIRISPSSVPISFHSKYYVRSGSTVQELRGQKLREFILKKDNVTWDSIILPEAKFEDLDEQLILFFISKAIEKNRMPSDARITSSLEVLQKISLITQKNELTRAAIILFAKNTNHYIKGIACKIGRFGKDSADLISHDVIECPLFQMPDRILELLKTKYLHSKVSYQGIERVETLEYPERAIREAILNSVIHRDYAFQGTEITIHVYADKLVFWNIGSLLEPLSIELLKQDHPSIRRNVLIADVFYRSGAIEAWGRGIKLITTESAKYHVPEPQINEHAGGIQITFFKEFEKSKEKSKEKIITAVSENPYISIIELSKMTGLSVAGVEKNLRNLKTEGSLLRIGPDKGGYWKIVE